MEKELKLALGKILGEVYRLQIQAEPNIASTSGATAYGLINGFEETINEQLENLKEITSIDVQKVRGVLQPIFDDPNRRISGSYEFKQLKYDEVWQQANSKGIEEAKFTIVLNYFMANDEYVGLLKAIEDGPILFDEPHIFRHGRK